MYRATYDGGGATDYYVHGRSNTTSMCYTYIKWATITPTIRTESSNTSSAISRNREFDGHCRAEETVGEGARTPAACREGDTVVVFFIFIGKAVLS